MWRKISEVSLLKSIKNPLIAQKIPKNPKNPKKSPKSQNGSYQGIRIFGGNFDFERILNMRGSFRAVDTVSGLPSSIRILTASPGFPEVDESAFNDLVPKMKESLPMQGTFLSLSDCFLP